MVECGGAIAQISHVLEHAPASFPTVRNNERRWRRFGAGTLTFCCSTIPCAMSTPS